MSDEIQKLQQEIAELKQRVEYTDDWAGGVQNVLMTVLPFLLRGHPEVEKVQGLLKSSCERYEELEQHPERATADDLPLAAYEPAKMLYRVLSMHGVWPGIDPHEAAKESLERYQNR